MSNYITTYFKNYTTTPITVRSTTKPEITVPVGLEIDFSSSTDDYTIKYNSKDYPITRKQINQLNPTESCYFFITDSITVVDPVENSTFSQSGQSAPLKSLTQRQATVVYAPGDGVVLQYGDGKWSQVNTGSNIFITLMIIFLVVAVVIVAIVGGMYFYKKLKN